MISASEALNIILEHTHTLGVEKVSLAGSLGRVLARDCVAAEDLPPFDNSSMDGFAVDSSGLKGALEDDPCVLKLIGESSAGNPFAGKIGPHQAIRVMTGGVIPRGADSVVPLEEATEMENNQVAIHRAPIAGQYIRKCGEDIKRHEVILRTGAILTPASIGVLAALGRDKVQVRRKPRVNIVATGNELIGLRDKPGRGQIRNSTSYGLAAYVTSCGGVPRPMGIARDRGKSLQAKLGRALNADMLLVTGGVSVGRYDLVRDVLRDLGVEAKFWRVNIKPGKPLLFGVRRKTLVFGLPGNPVSTYVTFLQFVRPALLRMAGCTHVEPLRIPAVLDQELSKQDGKRHYVRGIALELDGQMHVVTTGIQSSGAMSSVAKANCLIVVPEETMSIHKGETVEIELLNGTHMLSARH